ncbi:N-acetyltransferase family protein [Actinospongicola halichondriae]|uniref:GNAT family N-acetyltransferase n=1 Tax=Actinospongicola halichondriae TaxID=3236844 RepID=UPI003D4E49DF
MEVSARPADASDLDVVADLATLAIEELTPNRGGALWRREAARPIPTAPSVQADLEDADVHVVVGTIDDVPVGYGVVRRLPMRDGSTLGRVTDIFTLAGARGVGVGEAMMDAIIEWATDSGCFGIDSVALPGDRHTKNFFESFGLVARAIVVHRPLPS